MPVPYDPERFHRRSIRLKGYDYTQAGAYFVTLCVVSRECLFGEVVEGVMHLSDLGRIVAAQWNAIPTHFPNASLDVAVVMPNHHHGILVLDGSHPHGPRHPQHQDRRPHGTEPGSLGSVLQNFESVATRKVNRLRGTPGWQLWQRNYYEHVIRDEEEANRIRAYILSNPARWASDRENLNRSGPASLDAYPFLEDT